MMRMAKREHTALRGMLDAAVFADQIFGFHVQQAVEKSLKGWMCALGVTYPFTHHIDRLLVLLNESGADVGSLWWTDEFTVYARQARYEEDHLGAEAALDRSNILEQIDAALKQIEQAILALR